MERIRENVNEQFPFGTNQWIINICEKPALESTIRPIGRSRREIKVPVPFYFDGDPETMSKERVKSSCRQTSKKPLLWRGFEFG